MLVSIVNKSCAKDMSYLDPLQSGGGLWDTLWHIEAFGGTDFGVDQPLLEISQGCTKPLLQQALLVLTLSGCTKTETGEQDKTIHLTSCSEIHCHWEPLPLTGYSVNKEGQGLLSTRSIWCLLPMCLSKQRGYMGRCSDTAHTVLKLQRRRSKGDEHEWETARWRNGKVGEVEGISAGAKRESGGWC